MRQTERLHLLSKDALKVKTHQHRHTFLGAAAIALALLLAAVVGLLALFASASVGGTATLPGGTIATINGPFSCSETGGVTQVDAGGHVFAFTPTAITVDNRPIGPLDASVRQVEIEAGFWTAKLRINGKEVAIAR
jgi:hypothetical protein